MKNERVTSSKKTETIAKPKTIINFGEDLTIFFAISNVDLENFNLSITTNIEDLLVPLIQQITEIKDFLNLCTKMHGLKTKP